MIEAFNLGPFLIPTRPLILVFSLIFAIWFSNWLGGKFLLDKNQVKHVAENSAWFGLLGARLGFVVLNWSAYHAAPWTALYIWQPGYHYFSGVLAGTAYALWRVTKRSPELRRSFLTVLAGAYLAAGLVFTTAILSTEFLKQPGMPGTGDSVPNIKLQNLSAETVQLSDLAGRAVILNFWATWCPPCRREMPLLDELQKSYGEKGLSVIGLDINESPDLVKSYISTVAISYPIWVDAPSGTPGFDRSQEIFSHFGGVGLPTTIFIDRAGVIRRIYVGELSRGFLQNQAENILDN
jgi:thiol-disulfide isomerase/thioredoxin